MSTRVAVMRNAFPHEHLHDLQKVNPVFRVQCSCGYDGFSTSDKECPMKAVHDESFRQEEHGAIETAVSAMPQSALDNLVNAAVTKALEDYKKTKGGK